MGLGINILVMFVTANHNPQYSHVGSIPVKIRSLFALDVSYYMNISILVDKNVIEHLRINIFCTVSLFCLVIAASEIKK